MLNEALRRETGLLQFYEQIVKECDYPDIHTFVRNLAEERRKPILEIVAKLNEVRAKSQVMDSIISSYEP
jgi:hypothetical protein